MTQDRSALRTTLRAARHGIPAAQRIAAADALAARLLSLPFAPTEGHVAGYWAMDGEIALHAWQLALAEAVTYCLPVLGKKRQLRFAPWRPGTPLVQNRYGIPEPDLPEDALLAPEDMRMIVLPLVGFDHDGNRLGMGGGWYDRSLAFRQSKPAPPWLVGAGFSLQQVEGIASETWDVRLDAICTETDTHLITTAPDA